MMAERGTPEIPDYLEFTVDKFTFRVILDRFYTIEGLWVKQEGNTMRIGISDYLQQRSGDVAFAEIKPDGTVLALGEELAVIETIKVDISLSSPIAGRVKEVNLAMEITPEIINQDPYGSGWLVVIEPLEGGASLERLLDPHAYYARIKLEAEQEAKRE
jgi:glycine cleavage system H protein